MENLLKIALVLCFHSASNFEFPHECVEWLQTCQPILYPESGSVFDMIVSPANLGSLNLDCSASIDARLQQCQETEIAYCAIPFNTTTIRRLRTYICTNKPDFLAASGCWTSPLFLRKWRQCGRIGQAYGYCSPVDCLEDTLPELSADVCSQEAKSHIIELMRIAVQAMADVGPPTEC